MRTNHTQFTRFTRESDGSELRSWSIGRPAELDAVLDAVHRFHTNAEIIDNLDARTPLLDIVNEDISFRA